jgi:hypothetical protein
MTKTILLAGAAALALNGGAYAAAGHNSAAGARGTAQHVVHAPPKNMATLYDQNIGDTSYGFFSQTLSSYPQYDEYLADDFTVPAGHTWKVKEVDTTSFYYIGSGPANGVNVLFWKNKGGLPKGTTAMFDCENITPTSDVGGAFQIKLPKSCAVKLKGGASGTTYWVTVQANMKGINTSGYWAWTTNSTVAGNSGAGWWYGGGVSVPPQCAQAWGSMTTCTGAPHDFAFALLGKDKS